MQNVAECRDCSRDLGGRDDYFECCADHDLPCIVPEPASIELADVAIVAVHWAGKRLLRSVVIDEIEDGSGEGSSGRSA